MSDWSTVDVAVQVSGDDSLVSPPILGVVATFVLAAGSAVFLFSNSFIGYLVTVVASIVGGVTAFIDQKRRGNPNYSNHAWFKYALAAARYAAVGMALAHIIRQSIHAYHGGGIFG